MTEHTRKMLIYLALPAAVIWAVYNYPSGKKTIEVTDEATPEILQPVATATKAPDPRLIDIKAKTAESWGSDPFRLEIVAVGDSGSTQHEATWKLNGIIYNPKKPIAYVNGQPVTTGDVVDRATVKEIEKGSVTLDYNGRQITLTVSKG